MSTRQRDQLDEWIDKAVEADARNAPDAEDDVAEVERGPPPTESELRGVLDALSNAWLEPAEFKRITDAVCVRLGSSAWFNNPRLKTLHDAYVLARFASRLSVDRVRLSSRAEQWPDGFVKIDGRSHNVEVTSTHGGRKLGEEYRNPSEEWRYDPVEDWVARAESIPSFLDGAIGRKRKKRYSSPCWLVVYLNINDNGIRQKQVEQAIAATKVRYGAEFEAITVLWKGKLY